MIITIRNNAEAPGKYERKIKWLLYNLREKFNSIVYANVYFNQEGSNNPQYEMNIVIGIPGNDIVIKNSGKEWNRVIMDTYLTAKSMINKRLKK